VIDSEPDEGGQATVVSAKDGDAFATIDIQKFVATIGGTVFYESGPAGSEGKCRSHGVSPDGKVDWSAETPCFGGGSAVILGDRIYGVVEKTPGQTGGRDHPINDSFMIDTATGRWKMVGGIADFNLDSDARAGVAGDDIVVHRRDQKLTAVDPDTGDEIWDIMTPGDRVPGVSIANGSTVVLSGTDRGHNPFFAGDERSDGLAILVIDTATGDVTGKRTVPDIWNSMPAGKGSAVLVDRDELSLIGSAPD
jgi:outer membrane protein assembly factor BamB